MKLLTSQKNTLFEIIEKSGLSPAQFEINETRSIASLLQVATEITFKNSDFHFIFETGQNSSTSHFAIFCPGNDSYKEKEHPGSWRLQLKYFQNWLSNILREIKSEDKWDRLQKEIRGVGINFDNNNDKFSIQEYEDLRIKMTTLKTRISTIELLPEQLLVINDKLDFLTNSAKEMNKFDWKSLFIGTMISIIIQLNITTDNANLLWNLIKQVFNSYLLP